ncbi:MAG: hypothetical protein JWO08_1786 [Verrucomicrobiaceae bacterium]|nr:hypothetical protein [Verrucomicrobiaceae bacterium]
MSVWTSRIPSHSVNPMSDSPQPSIPLPDPDTFARSPIVLREASFSFEITQEEFDKKVPSLIAQLQQDGPFPEQKVKEQWKFELDLKEGKVPKPKVTMTQIPELLRPDGIPLTLHLNPPDGVQPASLILTQPFSDTNPTRFADLMAECETWVTKVFTHFGCDDAVRVALGYRNQIDRHRYPEMWTEEGLTYVDQLLTIFQNISNPEYTLLTGDFIIDYTRRFSHLPACKLRVKINSEPTSKGHNFWAATLVFDCGSSHLKKQGLKGALSILADAHSAIYKEFCSQFTQEALVMFSK